jgi:hypothetical protein
MKAECQCGFGGGIGPRKGGVGAPTLWIPLGWHIQPHRNGETAGTTCMPIRRTKRSREPGYRGLCRQVAVNLPLDLAAPAQPDHARRPGNNSAGSLTAAAGGQQTRTLTTARNVNFLPAIWSRRAAVYKAINVSAMDQMGGVLLSRPPKKQWPQTKLRCSSPLELQAPRGFACCARHGAR